MKAVNRQVVFGLLRQRWGPWEQSQVNGLDALLTFLENDREVEDPRWAAYMLATAKHETANTWRPIAERGPRSYFDKYEPNTRIGSQLGNVKPGDGYLFRGRGYPQLTGRRNYLVMGQRLVLPLLAEPDLAMVPSVAYRIMSLGMREGLYTGKALEDFINPALKDYRQARRIVNGMDRADLIAGYATDIEAALLAA